MRFSVPDYMFSGISDITPDFLKSIGISALICDIDNTLVTYDDDLPTENALKWFDSMHSAGIKIAFLSNNSNDRVEKFNSVLNYPAIADAKKPLAKNAKKLLQSLKSDKNHTAMLGDQIFTDVWCGRSVGIRTLIVPPIKDKTNLFFKSKRVLEKPFIKLYKVYDKKRKTQ